MKTKSITDMYLVAAFLSYGADLLEVDKENPKKQAFIFEDKAINVWKLNEFGLVSRVEFVDLGQVELLFRSEKLMFPPNYCSSVRSIKSMIHAKE